MARDDVYIRNKKTYLAVELAELMLHEKIPFRKAVRVACKYYKADAREVTQFLKER